MYPVRHKYQYCIYLYVLAVINFLYFLYFVNIFYYKISMQAINSEKKFTNIEKFILIWLTFFLLFLVAGVQLYITEYPQNNWKMYTKILDFRPIP